MLEYFKQFSSHIDFVGQHRAERAFQVILTVFGVIGFLVGYVAQQMSLMVFCVGAGCILSSLIVLPPWPCLRRNPLPWRKGNKDKDSKKNYDSPASSVGKKKKK